MAAVMAEEARQAYAPSSDSVRAALARPRRARPGAHRLLDADVVFTCECCAAESAEHDLFVVDDEAGIPAGGAHAGPNSGELLVEAAGGDIATKMRADPGFATACAFERQSGRAPVGLAGDVVVNVGEADALEPPRGPWAHVSLVVVAVDDHRPFSVELASRLPVEFLQRDVDRTGQVLLLELGGRQHLDKLRPLLADQPLQLVAVGRRRHQSATSARAVPSGAAVAGWRGSPDASRHVTEALH